MLTNCKGDQTENWFILWAVWLVANGVKTSSVRTYITGVRSSLVDWTGQHFGDFDRLPRLYKSLKWIFNEKTRLRLPILQQHLRQIRRRIDFSNWDDRLCFTAALVAWQGMLRKSEFCCTGSNFDASRNPSRADLVFQPGVRATEFADFTIKAHKTDRHAAWMPKRFFMCSDAAGLELNACAHLRELVALEEQNRPVGASDPKSVPLFRLANGKPLTYMYFKSWLKQHIAGIGVESQYIDTHSLRIGGATALLDLGASETVIKQAGRWLSSDCPQLYAHLGQESMQRYQSEMGARVSTTATSRHHITGWF